MKVSKQCPKCQSSRVGYLEQVYDREDHYLTEATLGVQVKKKNWLYGQNEEKGTFEAYVCADCGYYETYVKDPSSLPFEDLEGFQWLNPEHATGGAYR